MMACAGTAVVAAVELLVPPPADASPAALGDDASPIGLSTVGVVFVPMACYDWEFLFH